MKFAPIFSIFIEPGMIGQWMMSYFTKQIPELKTEPTRIWFHIAAELTTAICLLVSGIGLLITANW